MTQPPSPDAKNQLGADFTQLSKADAAELLHTRRSSKQDKKWGHSEFFLSPAYRLTEEDQTVL